MGARLMSLNPCSNGIWSLMTCARNRILNHFVLILVLMEYALWSKAAPKAASQASGLNPCSNGICSLMEGKNQCFSKEYNCLNPCSNGICSLIELKYFKILTDNVLILVLMEYALWWDWRTQSRIQTSLNPCSNGICSLIKKWKKSLANLNLS